MISGVLVFGAVVVLFLGPLPGPSDPSVFWAVLIALAPGLVLAWFVVGGLIRRGLHARLAESPHDEAAAVTQSGFFTIQLVGGAMAEAYSFYAIAAYMITAVPLILLGAGLGLLAMLVQLPTADRFHRFAEELLGHRPS